jgi:integrase
MKNRRTRGSGSVFRKHLSLNQKEAGVKQNPHWFIQFSDHGRCVREATHTTDRAAATQLLRQRLHEVDMRSFKKATAKPVKIVELYEILKLDRATNPKSRTRELPGRWKHLEPVFGHLAAAEVDTAMLRRYVAARLKEEAAHASINRELATLRRAFNLGKQSGQVREIPFFPMLKENNTRKGFVEDEDFTKLTRTATEPWLRTFLEVCYTYGWRKGEILGLRVRHLNFKTRKIRLDAGSTKNGDAREVGMTSAVFALLKASTEGKKAEDAVFTRGKRPVVDLRKAWVALTKRAGLPDLLIHDLRRSAAKSMRRAGLSESYIMATGGWKTRAMFERYAIGSESDQQLVVEALERAAAARAAKASSSPETVPFEGSSDLAAAPVATKQVQ